MNRGLLGGRGYEGYNKMEMRREKVGDCAFFVLILSLFRPMV